MADEYQGPTLHAEPEPPEPLRPAGPECQHTWVPARDIPPPMTPAHWQIAIANPVTVGCSYFFPLAPGMTCPVCGEVLPNKPPRKKRRTPMSLEPAEVYLHEHGVSRVAAQTAQVNCALTIDATPQIVALIATELRPEEQQIIAGSARVVGERIEAQFYIKGGNKRRVYTMNAEEAECLIEGLRRAIDFTDGKDVARIVEVEEG